MCACICLSVCLSLSVSECVCLVLFSFFDFDPSELKMFWGCCFSVSVGTVLICKDKQNKKPETRLVASVRT